MNTEPAPNREPAAFLYARTSVDGTNLTESQRRQRENGAKIAARLNLPLVIDPRFMVAVSGSKVSSEDRLAEFMAAIGQEVPVGSYLVCEDTDRFSREDAIDEAFVTLKMILKRGCGVVLGEQVFLPYAKIGMVEMIMLAVRLEGAADFSRKLGMRLKAVKEAKRQLMRATGKLQTSRLPLWFTPVKTGVRGSFQWSAELNPERAAIVRDIIRQATAGATLGKILIGLKDHPGFMSSNRRVTNWSRTALRKLLRSTALYGHWLGVDNVLPALITKAEFDHLQAMRPVKGQKTPAKGIFPLAGICRCSICGATVTCGNYGKLADGSKARYLVCNAAKELGAHKRKMLRLEPVIDALKHDLSHLLQDVPAGDGSILEELQQARVNLDGSQDHLRELVEAMDHSPSAAAAKLVADAEIGLAAMQSALQQLEVRAAGAVPAAVNRHVNQLAAVLDGYEVKELNLAMKAVFSQAVMDAEAGTIRLHWRHEPEQYVVLKVKWVKKDFENA